MFRLQTALLFKSTMLLSRMAVDCIDNTIPISTAPSNGVIVLMVTMHPLILGPAGLNWDHAFTYTFTGDGNTKTYGGGNVKLLETVG